MADFNFILTLAGLNSAININDNLNLVATSTADRPQVKVITAPVGVLTTVQKVIGFPLGLMVIQNIDENNSVIIRLEDTTGTSAIDRVLPAGGIMVLNSTDYDSNTTGAAFIAFSGTWNEVQAEGVDGNARVKIVYIPSA